MNRNFSTYETYDLNSASALVTLGYKLLKLDKTNPKKVRFVFKEEKSIDQAMLDYWNDEIKLPAQTLFNNQKMLKNRIYSNM